MKMQRRGVSAIIAELLLIVITVSIGTLVYTFASTAFGGFGAGFSNLVQDEGNKLSETLVVEQVYFFANSTSCPVGVTLCSGDLFVRNTGANTLMIAEIFVTNVTSNAPVHACTLNPCQAASNLIFWEFAAGSYSQSLPFTLAGCAPNSCMASLGPGQSAQLYFTTRDSIAPGTVFAFTLVTARGNQFVAYEKA